MKFIDDYPQLQLLSQALSFSSPSIKVNTRIEALSCKAVSREKKLFRALEQDLNSDLELSASISPPEDGASPHMGSVFGPLEKRDSRKTYWLLISTLNLAFPDFDFSSVPADDFAREPSASNVLSSLSSALNHLRNNSAVPANGVYRSFSSYGQATASSSAPSDGHGHLHSDEPSQTSHSSDDIHGEAPTHPYLRDVLDPIIDLNECEVYSYTPDVESDPHAAESEFGSTAASDAGGDDDDTAMDGNHTPLDDGAMWEMEGVPSSLPASPSLPNAVNDQSRIHRSGQAYLTNSPFRKFGRGRGRSRSALAPRSRSQTPQQFDDEESTGGLLWSCNYFFYNRSKKRLLFLSHHMRRLSPAGGLENTLPTAAEGFYAPRTPRASRPTDISSSLKRRGSNTSMASQLFERRSKRRG